jgi:hypothetical protein
MRNGRPLRALLPHLVALLALASVACTQKKEPAPAPSAAPTTPTTPAPAAAPPTQATGPELACPAGAKVRKSTVLGVTTTSCFDAGGRRQGRSMRVDAGGQRLQTTAYQDDVEHGALTVFAAGTDKVVARGTVEQGRLLRYELVGDPPRQGSGEGPLAVLRDRVKAEIERAQSCRADADCVVAVGSRCPFGCYVPTHKDEATRIKQLVEAFPRGCKYKCKTGGKPRCVEQRCTTSYH